MPLLTQYSLRLEQNKMDENIYIFHFYIYAALYTAWKHAEKGVLNWK
jgi:hypothetical protein